MTNTLQTPQNVKNAVGELILHALANGDDVDEGYVFNGRDMRVGDTAVGDWEVVIKRTSKP